MDAHLILVLNVISRCVAPSSLKKSLVAPSRGARTAGQCERGGEVVALASQERVEQIIADYMDEAI